eukprot:scaffold160060_cov63-Cyclotella_meneghiniana.AAC.2
MGIFSPGKEIMLKRLKGNEQRKTSSCVGQVVCNKMGDSTLDDADQVIGRLAVWLRLPWWCEKKRRCPLEDAWPPSRQASMAAKLGEPP